MSSYGLLRRFDPFAVLSIIIPFFVYLLTLAPSVTFFDSGEFITAIHSLGSPHSPGYPLFVLYAKPFTWLPFGNIAFRVNIATAFSAALASYGVYLLVKFLLSDNVTYDGLKSMVFMEKAVALGSALSFAFSDRLWLQSNHDKPYPLLAFLSAMILYLLLLWRKGCREEQCCPGYLYLASFICGLGLGTHQTMVLLVPSFAWLALSVDWSLLRRVKELILCLTFFILGLSVYLYLPIRATAKPLLNWGDPQTLPRFLWHFLRKGYPSEKVERDLVLLWKQISAFDISNEFTMVGVSLLVVGLVAFAASKKDEVVAYGLAICTFLAILAIYQNTPEEMIFLTEEFFTPLYLFTSVYIGLGFFWLIKKALQGVAPDMLGKVPFRLALVTIIVTLPATLFALNFQKNNQGENFLALDYANNSFRSLEPGSVLFTWGDSGAFPLWYLQGVEKMRGDIILLHTPHLVFDWYLDSVPEALRSSSLKSVPFELRSAENLLHLAIEEQIEKRPVYVDFSTKYSVKLEGYELQQQGICYRVRKGTRWKPAISDSAIWNSYTIRGIMDHTVPFRDLDTSKAILIYGFSRLDAGENLLLRGRRQEGLKELEVAGSLAPELKTRVRQLEKTTVQEQDEDNRKNKNIGNHR